MRQLMSARAWAARSLRYPIWVNPRPQPDLSRLRRPYCSGEPSHAVDSQSARDAQIWTFSVLSGTDQMSAHSGGSARDYQEPFASWTA